MTIFVADWQMTSDLTDEVAHRVADKWEMAWRLSWLLVQARVIVSAGELGIAAEHAIYVLLKRMRA
ncbi:hypothetical protein HLB23_04465 [Nocardia uniformis]|uniref:Uncharacterized protein n=1 Tax=Nocardia uniformis TaxID=53432 RepID=A0A849C841_9NOCA|nr:hypothetical protein [Nocardia uniformis]NNH69131.1 hypothetical protein [Nocardia uniformis]